MWSGKQEHRQLDLWRDSVCQARDTHHMHASTRPVHTGHNLFEGPLLSLEPVNVEFEESILFIKLWFMLSSSPGLRVKICCVDVVWNQSSTKWERRER